MSQQLAILYKKKGLPILCHRDYSKRRHSALRHAGIDGYVIRLFFCVRRVHLFHRSFFPLRLQSVTGEDQKRLPCPQGVLNGGKAFTCFHHREKRFSLYAKELFSIGRNLFHHRHKPPSPQTPASVVSDTSLCHAEHLCLSLPTQNSTK